MDGFLKTFFQFLDQNSKSLQLVHMITNPTQIKKMMISISEKEKDIIGIEESNLEDDIKATLENPNETYVVEFETLFQGAFVDNFEAILKNLYKLLDAEVKNEEDLVQANISPL